MLSVKNKNISVSEQNTDESKESAERLQYFNQELINAITHSLHNSQKSLTNKLVELMLMQEAITQNDKILYTELQVRNNFIAQKLDDLLLKIYDLLLVEVREKINRSSFD
jgi:DNA relaxase NicK